MRISGKVTPVCPCLCTQPVVVTCWDIPTHLLAFPNICRGPCEMMRAGKINDHLLISPRRSEASRSNFLMGSIGNESDFLHEVFCSGSPGLAV